MSRLLELPAETLIHIFQIISYPLSYSAFDCLLDCNPVAPPKRVFGDLCALACSCKLLHNVVAPFLYNNFEQVGHRKQVSLFLRTILTTPQHAARVKRIKIHVSTTNETESFDMGQLKDSDIRVSAADCFEYTQKELNLLLKVCKTNRVPTDLGEQSIEEGWVTPCLEKTQILFAIIALLLPNLESYESGTDSVPHEDLEVLSRTIDLHKQASISLTKLRNVSFTIAQEGHSVQIALVYKLLQLPRLKTLQVSRLATSYASWNEGTPQLAHCNLEVLDLSDGQFFDWLDLLRPMCHLKHISYAHAPGYSSRSSAQNLLDLRERLPLVKNTLETLHVSSFYYAPNDEVSSFSLLNFHRLKRIGTRIEFLIGHNSPSTSKKLWELLPNLVEEIAFYGVAIFRDGRAGSNELDKENWNDTLDQIEALMRKKAANSSIMFPTLRKVSLLEYGSFGKLNIEPLKQICAASNVELEQLRIDRSYQDYWRYLVA